MTERIETPVLVVGAGPVGLALAVDLGWRGVGCTVLEQGSPEDRLVHPRMDNVGIRTMEFARRWGITQAIENAGFPRDLPMSIAYTTAVLGPELARDVRPTLSSRAPRPFSPSQHELCPQNFFDPVLQTAAQSYTQNRLLYHHRLVSMNSKPDGVEALVERDDGTDLEIVSRYLVGCDGANSTVGRELDLSPAVSQILAYSTNIFIKCADLARRTTDRGYRYILMAPTGVWGSMVNIDGRDMWRLQVLGDAQWPNWTASTVDPFVRRAIGDDLPYELLSIVPWARRELIVNRYQSGRCFLAGDSAHQFSPTGGYGMNTGIAEATDLSWKLAAVLAGWGGQALLDSYDLERRPIAARNARQASENFAAMRSAQPAPRLLEPGREGDAVRATAGSQLRAAMQREWNSFGIHLGAIYRESPIIVCEEDRRPEGDVAHFVQSAEPGARAPHVWLSQSQSILDLLGTGFVLLEFCDAGHGSGARSGLAAAARRRSVPLHYHLITDDTARALYERRFVLVRPDGHVAWRGDALPRNPEALIERVRGAAMADLRDRGQAGILDTQES